MTREELEKKFWDHPAQRGVLINYVRWLEDEYLKLVNGNGLDKPVFPPLINENERNNPQQTNTRPASFSSNPDFVN